MEGLYKMKYILRLVLKNILFNKKKTISATIGTFLCAFFFSIEITMIYSNVIYNNNMLENTFGLHDGIYCTDELGLHEIVGNSNCKTIGIISVYFQSEDNNGSTKRKVVGGTFDQKATELCSLHITEGTFPVYNDEIMLEKSLLSVMFCDKTIGDTIELTVNEKTKKFTISGAYENISTTQWDIQQYNVPFVNAIVANEICESAKYYFLPVIQNEKIELSDSNILFCPNNRDNYDIFSAISGGNFNNGIIILVLTLSVFTFVAMIALSYIIKKGEEKTIGLWKSINFSTNDIFVFYVTRLLILNVPSIALGSVLGYALQCSLGSLYGNCLICLICFAVCLSVVVISYSFFIGVEIKKTTFENLSYSVKCKEVRTTNFSTGNPILLYSIKNYILNGKEIAMSSVSLFLALFILLISSSVMANAEDYLNKSKRVYDVLLNFSPHTVTSLNISLYGEAGLSNQEYNLLKEKTDEIIGIKSLYVYEVTEEPLNPSNVDEQIIHDREILGFPLNNLVEGRLLGVDDETINLLKKNTIGGKLDIDELQNGKSIAICVNSQDESTHSVGDKITLAFAINENINAPSYDEISYHEIEVTVTALIDIGESENMLSECIQGGFLWSEKAFDSVNVTKNYSDVYSIIGNHDDFYEIIDEFESYYGKFLNVYDFSKERENYEKFFYSLREISLVISIGLSFFSILFCAITAFSRIVRRRDIFGCLRAIGLTNFQLTKIIFIENGLSIAISSVLGIICGLIVILIMNTPISGILLAFSLFAANLISVSLISYVAAKIFFSKTVVECISFVD